MKFIMFYVSLNSLLGEGFLGRVTSVAYGSREQFIGLEGQLPKALFAIDFKPTAKLAQFSIEMRNVVGALQEQTESVGKLEASL